MYFVDSFWFVVYKFYVDIYLMSLLSVVSQNLPAPSGMGLLQYLDNTFLDLLIH